MYQAIEMYRCGQENLDRINVMPTKRPGEEQTNRSTWKGKDITNKVNDMTETQTGKVAEP